MTALVIGFFVNGVVLGTLLGLWLRRPEQSDTAESTARPSDSDDTRTVQP